MFHKVVHATENHKFMVVGQEVLLEEKYNDFRFVIPVEDVREFLSRYDRAGKKENATHLHHIIGIYKTLIKDCMATSAGNDCILNRLQSFTREQLVEAMGNFSQDHWNMTHNAHRGMAWFFASDDRIDAFIHMDPQEKSVDNKCPICRRGDMVSKRYNDRSPSIEPKWHNIPILECSHCAHRQQREVLIA